MINHHLKHTWKASGFGHFTKQESKYIKYYEEIFNNKNKFKNFLEIGPGTGDFANYIIENYFVESYTILDIEKNINFSKQKLKMHGKKVKFICSYEYENIFEKEYDLFINIQCLSETPDYYYKNVYKKIECKNFFIIDGNPHDENYEKEMKNFVKNKNGIFTPETKLYPRHGEASKQFLCYINE